MAKAKDKIKYDIDTTARCTECGKDINVGTAGPAGLSQHTGKSNFCNLASKANELLAINQTHFTMEAIPSRRLGGRTRRTRDFMAEMFVCICGSRVEEQERVMGSQTALRCGYEGRETSWFHLACFNFTCAPKNWRCENDARSKKRRD